MKLLTLCLTMPMFTFAADWYVAPNGRPSNSGTLATPWNLETAISGAAGQVKPGDVVWVRGGVYTSSISDGFNATVSGTAAAPVIFRAYNHERATVDGFGTAFTLMVRGEYQWWWGIEFMDHSTSRTSPTPNQLNSYGPSIYARGARFINCVIHDTAQGISAYDSSPDSEFSGNIVYYNGYYGSDRQHGHGIYMQNVTGIKRVDGNIVHSNALEGLQIYGSGAANVQGFRISHNVSFQNSNWPGLTPQYQFIIAGGATRRDIKLDSNYTYVSPDSPYGFNSFGQYTDGDDVEITNSVFAYGYEGPSVRQQRGPVVFTGNRTVTSAAAIRQAVLQLVTGGSVAGWTWDRNAYYGPVNRFFFGTSLDFATWKSATGLDSTSTYSATAPTGVWAYVLPNAYETKRAHVAVYNWDRAATVELDLSSVLAVGDTYDIRDSQNLYGPPVAFGVVTAGAKVRVPTTGLTMAAGMGINTANLHSAPLFNAYVVTSSASQDKPIPELPKPVPQPTPTPGPTPTPTPTPVPTPPPAANWPTPGQAVALYWEAESGTITAPMSTRTDSGASGGSWVATTVREGGSVTYTVTVPVAGVYGLWGRILSPDAGRDSVYVVVDGKRDTWDTAENNWRPEWQWRRSVGRGDTGEVASVDPLLFTLAAGQHTIVLQGREANAGFDRLMLTNDPAKQPNDADPNTGQPGPGPGPTPTPTPTSGITWSSVGTLPPGLSLSQDGTLSGTPSAAGTYSFTIQVTDGAQTATRQVTITIGPAVPSPAPGLAIDPTPPPQGTAGVAYLFRFKLVM